MKLRWFVAMVLIVMSLSVARAQTKYPPETRNAALRYWLAFAEMRDPPADKTTQDLLEKTAAGEAVWDETRLGPILDANGEAIRTMRRATKLPECDWGVEYDRGVRAAIPYVSKARVLAKLNQLDGMRAMAKGDSQAAVEAWLAGVRFSQHLANVGPLIFALVAKSALLPNLRSLATETKQGHLSNTQKKQLSAALKELREDGFDWGAAWGLEELTLQQFLAELRSATNPRAAYESLMGEPMPSGAGVPSLEDTGRFREYMASVQAVLNLPPDTAKARLLTLQTQKRALPEVIQRLIPSAQKVNDARLEILAARKELLETLAAK
jgi:hypothetical protein